MTNALSTVPATTPPSASRWTFVRIVTYAVIGLIVAIVALFAIALVFAFINAEGAASFFRFIRDVFMSVMCLQSILIIGCVGLLIVQIARFVNLLLAEAKPIAADARETLRTVKTTSQFVSEQTVEPIVAAKSWAAGLGTLMSVFFSVRALAGLFKKKERLND